VLGLIGPNGAGKTTLVNVLSGFQAPDSGTVSLDRVEVTGRSPTRLAHDGLGRTFQAALPFPDLSGLESVAVGAMGMGVSRRRALAVAADVLGRLDLLEQARLPAGALPPGSQRLLGIARALAIGPRYLLLDEPAAGLNDTETEELAALLRAIRESGITLLIVEHNMSLVMNVADQVIVLEAGRLIAAGRPAEVQANPRVIAAYLGQEASP
jgi:branched-chain amino acid transport system ATP-binding protein